MKAAVYYTGGAPDVLRYEDVPDPECGPRNVLVEVHAISIEGGDVLARSAGPAGPAPHCGGYLAAGIIREVGNEVKDRFVGQRVTTADNGGSHASLRSVNSRSAWPIPVCVLSIHVQPGRSRTTCHSMLLPASRFHLVLRTTACSNSAG